MTGEAEQISSDKLVKVYLKMQDARAKLSKEFDEADGVIKSQMRLVEVELLKVCNSVGASSIRTEYGTIMRGVDTRYWTSDWGAMHEFIKETGQVDLLERRVAQGNMKEFLSSNPDKMPKGMNIESSYKITIRRS